MVDPVSFGPARPVQERKEPSVERHAATISHDKLGAVATPSLPKLVNMAAALASEAPPVDIAKIEQIRSAIAMGNYRVDPEAIADAMVAYYGEHD